MYNRLKSHLYLHSKNILTLKKSSRFPGLLIEKSDNCFAVAKLREKHLKEKNILRKGPAFLLKFLRTLCFAQHGCF